MLGAPQIPKLDFSFAMLAKLGPWLPGVGVFLIPALALAVDHREPKALLLDDEGFEEGMFRLKEVLEVSVGFWDVAGEEGEGAGMEVK